MAVETVRDLGAIPDDLRPAQYQRLARELAEGATEGLEPLRLAMLSSFALDFVRPVLAVEGARAGILFDLHLGKFGQLEQPIYEAGGPLYQPAPDLLVLAFQPSDLAPDVVARFYETRGEHLDSLCAELLDRLVGAARTFRDNTGQPVLVSNFAMPSTLPLGPFDAGDPRGLTHRLAEHNRVLSELLHQEPHIYPWDYAGLVRAEGSAAWTDPRLRLLARAAVSPERQPAMARHLLRNITALRRKPAKCLVLDLDNTLWGGVVGDDGMEGLQLGDDWPGVPFKELQRAALGLRDRGFLLAVVSKNDESVAKQVFERHPEMLVRWDHLAAVRINWEPKSLNMASIATELNIGVDSLVLFDDNPVERAEVRASLPEAGVIEVPTDPSGYVEALLSSGFFDQFGLSAEDRERADMYQTERQRATLMQEAPSLETFLESLEMEADVGQADEETLGRIAQLVGKTNQFNLTTRRHSPAELASMAEREDAVVAWLRLRDRFGEQGLIAVGILLQDGEDAFIDTFLMSCRVMNRGVERAMVAYLAERALVLDCRRLIGEYRPTAKNHMVSEFYLQAGFAAHGESENDGTLWSLELSTGKPAWPSHIDRIDVVTE